MNKNFLYEHELFSVIFMHIVLSYTKSSFIIIMVILGILIFPSISVLSVDNPISEQDNILTSNLFSLTNTSNLIFNKDNFSSIIYTENQSQGMLAGVYWGDQALAAVVIQNITRAQCGDNRIGVVIGYRQLIGVAKIYINGYLTRQEPIYNIRMNYFYLGSLFEYATNNTNGLFEPSKGVLQKCANLANLSWNVSFSNTAALSDNPTSLAKISITATNLSYGNNSYFGIYKNNVSNTNFNKTINFIQYNFTISADASPVNESGYNIYPVELSRRSGQIIAIKKPIYTFTNINGYNLGFNVKVDQKIVGWNFSNSNTYLALPVNVGVMDLMSPLLPRLSVILQTVFLGERDNFLGAKPPIQKNNLFEYQFQSIIRKSFQNSFGQLISFQGNGNNGSINDSTLSVINPEIIKSNIFMKNLWELDTLVANNSFGWINNGTFDNNPKPISFQINKANVTKDPVQYAINQQPALINKLDLEGNFIYPQGETIIIDPSIQTLGAVLQFPSIPIQTFNVKNTLEFAPLFLLGLSIILTISLVIIHFKKKNI